VAGDSIGAVIWSWGGARVKVLMTLITPGPRQNYVKLS
jgi:hypothetical protein